MLSFRINYSVDIVKEDHVLSEADLEKEVSMCFGSEWHIVSVYTSHMIYLTLVVIVGHNLSG